MRPALSVIFMLLAVAAVALRPHHPLTKLSATSMGGHTMGSIWSVKLRQAPPIDIEQLQREIQSLLDALDRQMSLFNPDSDLSRFNRHAGTDWIAVPPELADVVSIAKSVTHQTRGAFDITVAPLVSAWGFGPAGDTGQAPSATFLAELRADVGNHLLEVRTSPPALRKAHPKLTIDLGGIGKGYAADRVAEHLEARGVREYLVSIAGDLRASGKWRVGIETPTPGVRRVLRTVELHREALSTSGDYRNFHEREGRRYAHSIDPRTGRPVEHELASVSVMADSAARADALATGLLVLGPKKGWEVAKELGLRVVFVRRAEEEFDVRKSAVLEGR